MKINSLNRRIRMTRVGTAYDIDLFESISDDVNATFAEMGLSAAIVYSHDMPELDEIDLDDEFTIKIWCANEDVACEFVAQTTGE